MRIAPNHDPVELSYEELLAGLSADLESDVCIPSKERCEALELVKVLKTLLSPYSA